MPYFDARLSEEFLDSLLGWIHSGFSVHGEQTVPTEDARAPSASRATRIDVTRSTRESGKIDA